MLFQEKYQEFRAIANASRNYSRYVRKTQFEAATLWNRFAGGFIMCTEGTQRCTP
jgi:hypothetical protein